jgi:hypothetical protein
MHCTIMLGKQLYWECAVQCTYMEGRAVAHTSPTGSVYCRVPVYCLGSDRKLPAGRPECCGPPPPTPSTPHTAAPRIHRNSPSEMCTTMCTTHLTIKTRARICKHLRSPGIDSEGAVARQIGLLYWPARSEIDSWAPEKVYKYGLCWPDACQFCIAVKAKLSVKNFHIRNKKLALSR